MVVAGSPRRPGMPAMAVIATKSILRFRPQLVILCGISAGAREQGVRIGDILVPEKIYVHDAGKVTAEPSGPERFLPEPWAAVADPRFIKDISVNGDLYTQAVINDWTKAHRAKWPVKDLETHLGPLASGNVVVDSPRRLASILSLNRKTAGVEMEGYAVLLAARECDPESTSAIVIKAVCDYAQSKGDEHQALSAWISARFAYRFLTMSSLLRPTES